MSGKPDRDRELIRQGSKAEDAITSGYREWLADLLPEVAPSLEERVVWLTEELIRARNDHQNTCRLAWELYLAGTGQNEAEFRGVSSLGPVEEVKIALLDARLTGSGEKRNVSDDTNQPRRDRP